MAVRELDPPPVAGATTRRRRTVRTPYVLLAPSALLVLAFVVYPIGSVLWFSFQDKNRTEPWNDGWAGLDNYRRMLTDDPLFWDSLVFSAQWVFVQVGLQLFLGLGLALIVNEAFVGRGLARAVVFSPWAVSGILTTGIWVLLYNPTTGFLAFLADLGLVPQGIAVLADVDTAFWALVLTELWRGVPFFAILLLADLQSASKELYEAAAVDGAGRWRRFVHITLPHLRDAIVLSTLLRAVWEFNNVDLIYTLTGGGPADGTTTLPLYVAATALESSEFGYGSALTMAAFLILFVCSVLYLRLSRFGDSKD